LPATGKRTDVTFSSDTCVVKLELKQVQDNTLNAALLKTAHEQLSGYVKARRRMEKVARSRAAAGFVVAMCNNGASYVVQKLII
jgi:hypothetical protein